MSKEIIVKAKNSQLALNQTKKLLSVTTKVLSNDLALDESWIHRLWAWADINLVDDRKLISGQDYKRVSGCLEYADFIPPPSDCYNGLPRNKEQLLNITELFLINYDLKTLPREIGKLTKLKKLSLAGNKLRKLPAEIGDLKELTKLEINQNRYLTELPLELFNLRELTTLDLSKCRLTKLPVEICNLQNLTRFYLYGSNLKTLPIEIMDIKQLRLLVTDKHIKIPRNGEKRHVLVQRC